MTALTGKDRRAAGPSAPLRTALAAVLALDVYKRQRLSCAASSDFSGTLDLIERITFLPCRNARGLSTPVSYTHLPCYNEADNIPLFYKTATECFEQAGVSIEIVFVNDGSQDGTAQLLRRVVESARGKHAVQAIDFSRNFGKESALYAGCLLYTSRCV